MKEKGDLQFFAEPTDELWIQSFFDKLDENPIIDLKQSTPLHVSGIEFAFEDISSDSTGSCSSPEIVSPHQQFLNSDASCSSSGSSSPELQGSPEIFQTTTFLGQPSTQPFQLNEVQSLQTEEPFYLDHEDRKEDEEDLGQDPKRKRKRQKNLDSEPFVGKTAVSLPRDQLLKISSEDLEKFVNSVLATRPLTYEEKKEVSRQRRLIKNRESALASRIRKKSYVDELEKQVSDLKHEKAQLQTQLSQLEMKCRQLQQKVDSFSKSSPKLEDNDALNSTVTVKIEEKVDFVPSVSSLAYPSLWNSGKAQKGIRATSGICLFIILFSFGLFFQNLNFTRAPPSKLTSPRFPDVEIHNPFARKSGSASARPNRILLEADVTRQLDDSLAPHRNTCANSNDNVARIETYDVQSMDEDTTEGLTLDSQNRFGRSFGKQLSLDQFQVEEQAAHPPTATENATVGRGDTLDPGAVQYF